MTRPARLLLSLALPSTVGLLLLTTHAQDKPADPVKPATEPAPATTHKTEQSILNRLKQDDRNKAKLQEALDKLKDLARRNQAADAELKRIDPKSVKDEDPAKVVENLKGKMSDEDLQAIKKSLEDVKDAVGDDAARLAREMKEKAMKSKGSAHPSGTPAPPPIAFTKVAPPKPAEYAPKKRAQLPDSSISADEMIYPPQKNPDNPEKTLPPTDIRARSYHASGNVIIRTPAFALDADKVDWIMSPDADGGGGLGMAPAGKSGKKNLDPVAPGAGEKEETPIDRAIAVGRVNVVRIAANGTTQTGKGGYMLFDKKSGEILLKDWPEAIVGQRRVIGNAKDSEIILPMGAGEPKTNNCRFESIAEGKSRPAPAPAAPAPR